MPLVVAVKVSRLRRRLRLYRHRAGARKKLGGF
jgi:hypothetical protein